MEDDAAIASNAKKRRLLLEDDNNDNGGERPVAVDDSKMKSFLVLVFQRVKNDPAFWEALPDEWKQDRDVTLTALRNQCVIWNKLDSAWRSDRDVVLTCIRHGRGVGRVRWGQVALELRSDQEVALAAWKKRLVRHAAVVPCLDQEFWRNAVQENKISWTKLPNDLKTSQTFARSIDRFTSDSITSVFQDLPNLRQERDMWVKIIDSGLHNVGTILEKFAPPAAITSDRELMTKACKHDDCVLSLVDVFFQTDRTFLESVLDAQPRALVHLTHPAQRQCADLVQQKLEPFCRDLRVAHGSCNSLAVKILPELWQDRSFAEAWFRAGLPFVDRVHPASWRDDKEIFLLIAEHCRREFRRSSFANSSPTLRNDKEFMMQVIALGPLLFLEASRGLQQDFDVAVLALAGAPLLLCFAEHFQEKRAEIRRRINEKLAASDTFVKNVLCAISIARRESNVGVCALPLLNQGAETSRCYKSLIAEYAGVPVGRELRLLRRAADTAGHDRQRYQAARMVAKS